MAATMQFVGGSVNALLQHGGDLRPADDILHAAEEMLALLQPIGASFDMPWKFTESLDVLGKYLPDGLAERLQDPGRSRAENHFEACLRSLALEAGVCLEPLTKSEMMRLQHVARHATDRDMWGRQSPYPWDTVADADLLGLNFFAFSVGT